MLVMISEKKEKAVTCSSYVVTKNWQAGVSQITV